MAVLFPTPFGTTLSPKNPAQLLQAFVNIENAEGVNTGDLTRANLSNYLDKRFFAVDPSHEVASYLFQKFDSIAPRDGNGASISVSDLVQLRRGLPNPDCVPVLPQAPPPVTPGGYFPPISSSLSSAPPDAPLGDPALSSAPPGVPLGDAAVGNAPPGAPFCDPALSSALPGVPLGDPALSSAPPGAPLGDPALSSAPPGAPLGDPALSSAPPGAPLGDPALSSAPPGAPLGDPALSNTPFGALLGNPALGNANSSLGSSLSLLVLSLLNLLSNLVASLSGSNSR